MPIVDVASERCATLAEVWRWWAATLSGLEPAAWTRPSRLPGWDVAALVSHASLLVGGLRSFLRQPLDGEPTVGSARELLMQFNEPGGVATTFAEQVAEGARRPRCALLAIWCPPSRSRHRTSSRPSSRRDRSVGYFGVATVPIDAAVSLATLEAVAHGLDLCASCDVPPATIPTRAMDHTVQLLASMAPPVAFVEAATGRGDADVLPVLR